MLKHARHARAEEDSEQDDGEDEGVGVGAPQKSRLDRRFLLGSDHLRRSDATSAIGVGATYDLSLKHLSGGARAL